MEIIDTTLTGWQIEQADQIVVEDDFMQVDFAEDSEHEGVDTRYVKGYSHITGDSVEYHLDPDLDYSVWSY